MKKISVEVYKKSDNENFNMFIGNLTTEGSLLTRDDINTAIKDSVFEILDKNNEYGEVDVRWTIYNDNGEPIEFNHKYIFPCIYIDSDNGNVYAKDKSIIFGPGVMLSDINKIKEFNKIALTIASDVILKSGRYVVNAKSLLGIFSLDLTKPVEVIVDGMSEFTVNKIFDNFTVSRVINGGA